MNTAWMVPRNHRPNPLKARGRSVLLLVTTGLVVVATTVLSILGGRVTPFGVVGHALLTVVAVLVNAGVFLLVFRIATARPLTVRQIAPGAVIAALVWQLLQSFGGAYVSHVVAKAGVTNGVFALVLGLLAFLYVASLAVVLSAEINVVRAERLYPRALLTPFTDDVELTGGDERTYAGAARSQRMKGFQEVLVRFHGRHRGG
jgi:uncharacterized BrkB/YihY/UPF0761 family membrane protein